MIHNKKEPHVVRVGFGCNNNCKFCFQISRIPLFRSIASIKKELIHTRLYGFSYVVFEGGEALLRDDIFELIKLARKLGFTQIDVQSNGRMFSYKELCQKFIDLGVSAFGCSLQSHTEIMHDFIASTPGSFKETVQGIKNLKALGQTVSNQTVVSKFSYRFLHKIVSFLIDLKVDRIQFNFIQLTGTAERNFKLLALPIKKVIPYVKKALAIGIKAGREVGAMGMPYCILDDYGKYTAEYKRAKSGSDTNNVLFKHKGEVCRGCLYYNICEGPWISYVKYFGWEEFRPIIK